MEEEFSGQGEESGSLEGLLMFEHAEDSVEELAHDGDQGLHFGFAARQEVGIEGAQVRLMADGDQRGHVEGAAQVAIAVFADTRFLMHGAARGMLPRVEARLRDPLGHLSRMLCL